MKIYFKISILVFITLFYSGRIIGQNSPGEISVNAGLGYSIILPLIASSGSSSGVSGTYPPAYNGIVDFGIMSRFSIGVGLCYESTTITTVNQFSPYGYYTGQPTKEIISRTNLGIRPLWHFGHTEKLDGYLGGRMGVSFWKQPDNSNSNFSLENGNFLLPTLQFVIGVRTFLTSDFGLHAEAAFGSPYFIEVGISFRFHGNFGYMNSIDNNNVK
jgi:hypothetical protein